MINPIRIFFRNIIPATFENALTYLEQLHVLKDKVNEVIDVVNAGGFEFETGDGLKVDGGVISTKVDGETIKFKADGTMYAEGGGGSSDEVWLPSVTEQGVLSWSKSSSDTPPTPVDIKGPQGETGATGATGATGPQGPAGQDGTDGQDGVGVPSGGTAGQVLAKRTGVDYDTEWVDQSGGGAESDYLWKPTVDAQGNISWLKTTSTTTPATQNIKGPQGPAGQNGTNGQDGTDGTDGYSPIATVSAITGGARISITDKNGTTTADVMNGTDGQDGTDGVGVPSGGTAGQILAKASGTDFDTEWINAPSGGGSFELIPETNSYKSIYINVNNSGDTAQDGTQAHPYDSIEKAINLSRENKMINLIFTDAAQSVNAAKIDGTGYDAIILKCITGISSTITISHLYVSNCDSISIDFSKIEINDLNVFNSILLTPDDAVQTHIQDIGTLNLNNSKFTIFGGVDNTAVSPIFSNGLLLNNSILIAEDKSTYVITPSKTTIINSNIVIGFTGDITLANADIQHSSLELFKGGDSNGSGKLIINNTVSSNTILKDSYFILPYNTYTVDFSNCIVEGCNIDTLKGSYSGPDYQGIIFKTTSCKFTKCNIGIKKMSVCKSTEFLNCTLSGMWECDGDMDTYSTSYMWSCVVIAVANSPASSYASYWSKINITGGFYCIGCGASVASHWCCTINGTWYAP